MTANPRGFTGRLAAFATRNPWKIVIVWVLAFLVIGSLSAVAPAEFTTEANFTNDPESVRAEDLMEERTNGQARPDEFVVIQSDSLTVDDAEFRSFVDELATEIAAVPEDYVGQVINPFETGDESFIADDRRAVLMPVFIGNFDVSAEAYVETIEEANDTAGFTVATGGQESIDLAFEETSESDLLTGETIGISVALIVLLIVFGSLVSSGLPLGLAISSIAIAIGLTTALGHVFSLSFFVTNMIVMIGLAVGIDYALFIVGRYREELKNGLGVTQAIVRAGDSASKAVLFSGMTVVVALLGMLLVPSNIFMSLGAGAIIVVIVSVAATLTLLPAVLALLNTKINRGTDRTLTGVLSVFLLLFAALFAFGMDVNPIFPIIYAVLGILAALATVLNLHILRMRSSEEGGFWDRITGFVMRHPVAIVSTSTVVLAGIALIYFSISLGQSGVTTLPEDTSPRTAFELLESEFSGMSLEDPNVVVVDAANVNDPAVQAAIDDLIAQARADGEFGPAVVQSNDAGNLATIALPAASDTQSTAALHSIERLRDDYIPSAFQGVNAEALVTGPSAETVDFNAMVDTYTPIVFIFVLGMSLILLLLAFRSIVVPIKSVIMNLLSVGASYGLLVAVFQHGWGNEIFGFQQVDRIDAWIPLMMFTILFGLSMDYHVFLLSRIKEHYDLTGNNAESVAYGLRSTAAIITGAALIMVAVFGGFAMGQMSMFQQMGFGLATAVILDASVVRVFLVPSGMKLLNDWNWYFPNWLGWLPKINVEGVSDEQLEPAPASAGD